jgi:hypothetical protein
LAYGNRNPSIFLRGKAEGQIKRAEADDAGDEKDDRYDAQDYCEYTIYYARKAQDTDNNGYNCSNDSVKRSHVLFHFISPLSFY